VIEMCSKELEIESSCDLSVDAGGTLVEVVSMELGFPKEGTNVLAPRLNLNSGAPARNPDAAGEGEGSDG
jgi:hypothetical protein